MLYQFDLAGMLKTWCNPSNAKFFLKTRFTVGDEGGDVKPLL